jgi:hypothetical protein
LRKHVRICLLRFVAWHVHPGLFDLLDGRMGLPCNALWLQAGAVAAMAQQIVAGWSGNFRAAAPAR